MKTINCEITNQELRVTPPGFPLVAGSVGLYQLSLAYDSQWDDAPNRVVVFKGCGCVSPVTEAGGEVVIPSSVLAKAGGLSIGVIGYSADGAVRITTKEMVPLRVSTAGATPEEVGETCPEADLVFWEELVAEAQQAQEAAQKSAASAADSAATARSAATSAQESNAAAAANAATAQNAATSAQESATSAANSAEKSASAAAAALGSTGGLSIVDGMLCVTYEEGT